jgi:Fur family ferric uptake transcriptional regulator
MGNLTLHELQDAIREAGLRSTAPRVAVLRILLQAKSPLSHADVADALAQQGFDRATVYRNLSDLTNAGLVRRTDHGDHIWRFELITSKSHDADHPHFICNSCGTVTCLPETAVSLKPRRGLPGAFRQKSTLAVQFRGLCDGCV